METGTFNPGTGVSNERRTSPRTTAYRAGNLQVESKGLGATGFGASVRSQLCSRMGAELIDASDTGLGLRVFTPLVIGSEVAVRVELHSALSCVELKIDGRVMHCFSHEDELYRVGLSFLEVDRLPLQCVHEGGYLLNLDGPDSE